MGPSRKHYIPKITFRSKFKLKYWVSAIFMEIKKEKNELIIIIREGKKGKRKTLFLSFLIHQGLTNLVPRKKKVNSLFSEFWIFPFSDFIHRVEFPNWINKISERMTMGELLRIQPNELKFPCKRILGIFIFIFCSISNEE